MSTPAILLWGGGWGGGEGQMSPMPFFMGVNRRVGQFCVGELS